MRKSYFLQLSIILQTLLHYKFYKKGKTKDDDIKNQDLLRKIKSPGFQRFKISSLTEFSISYFFPSLIKGLKIIYDLLQ